ncbi:axoneme-associated protein mst101(2) [Ceratitis capitata]|uniref:axoneme-associated protein mst101(2) n=1 Tax=Ceratitis capitata TaxID=7213 RepID=UPI000329D32B|nr:axoneme-associated protein mst101(2) [Ceratitis capitata]
MGVGKSRVEAKRCSCDELAKPDSLNAVVRTRVSCRSSDSKNHNRKSSNPTRDATKKRSLHHKNDYHKFPNKHVESPSKPRVNKNNEYQCYTALNGQRYSVDALTPEEQFEEVEKVFREKKIGRAPTQINRRPSQSNRQVSSASACESAGNASETASLTDSTHAYTRKDDSPSLTATRLGCNPDCRCGGNKSSAQPALVIERRNGLQKVGHSNAGCQCVLYDGRVGRLHEAELSQAQAIAIAVREYCAQRRKSGRGHGQYCLCSKDVLPKPQWQEDEELETESQRKNEEKYLGRKDLEKGENETEDDIDDDVEEGEDEDEGERVENAEWAAEIDERRKSRAEYDELFADEQRELEKYLPETRRRLHDSEQIDPESGKRSRRRNEKDSREFTDQDAFSLSDVELQVQTVVSTTQDTPRHAPKKPQGRQPPNNTARRSSDAKQNRQRHEKLRLSTLTADEKDCKCCSCGTKELGELEIAHEEEVIVKETNLSPRSPDDLKSESTKPKREQPSGRIESEELRAGRANRRVSTESAIESSSQEEDCRCCDCDKATMTDWTDVDQRTISEKKDKNFDNRLTHDHEPRHKEYVARARRSTESETEHERVKSSQAKWEPKDAYAIAATQFNKEGHKREKLKQKSCCRSSEDDAEKDLKPCCPCKKDNPTASTEKHSDERTESESDSAHKMHSTERITGRSAERKSHSNRQRKKSNASDGDRRRSYVRRRSRSKSEKECQTYCRCKKTKGVPLTKCCKCHEEFAYSAAHQQDEDMKRRKLAEELADRIQRRAELQIALQKRLQEQRRAKQKQYCCCDPPTCCFPLYKCCEMQAPEPMSVYDATQKSPYCCCPSPPCCHTTTCGPPCCCEPAPCFGQDCPCCCQPLKYCYPPSCAYPRTGL